MNTKVLKKGIFIVGFLLIIIVSCSKSNEQQQNQPVVNNAATNNILAAQFGGIVQKIGNYIVEILPKPDGQIEAQIRNEAGQPVSPDEVQLNIEIQNPVQNKAPDSAQDAVQVVMIPKDNRFVGTIPGVQGTHNISVSLKPATGGNEVNVTFPQVSLQSPQISVEPVHQGQVSIVGDNKLEVAMEADGKVMVSVADLQGNVIPTAEVDLREITVETSQGPKVVVLQPEGAFFVGRIDVPPPPNLVVHFNLGVHGVHYRHVRIHRIHPLPRGVIVNVVPPPFPEGKVHHNKGLHKGWGNKVGAEIRGNININVKVPPPVVEIHGGVHHQGGLGIKGNAKHRIVAPQPSGRVHIKGRGKIGH